MTLLEWALKHKIQPDALTDLCMSCMYLQPPNREDGRSESVIQRDIRLEYARAGAYLFRNNRGAGKMESGSYVRYGLANDSKVLGDSVKSADLIGFEPVTITRHMEGRTIARFLSVEVKAKDHKFTGTLPEFAQAKWAALVNSQGGRAVITNQIGTALTPQSDSR